VEGVISKALSGADVIAWGWWGERGGAILASNCKKSTTQQQTFLAPNTTETVQPPNNAPLQTIRALINPPLSGYRLGRNLLQAVGGQTSAKGRILQL
jgi:hypothetical protein